MYELVAMDNLGIYSCRMIWLYNNESLDFVCVQANNRNSLTGEYRFGDEQLFPYKYDM